MDKYKHTDWTDSVRERLEGRELTPSDALWERIGEALPQAGAERRVRRLPWGGVLAAAAAAAVAAVLFLRPAGAPEPGRVDVVLNAAPPVAMADKAAESVPEVTESITGRGEESDAESGRSFATLRMTGEGARMTGEGARMTRDGAGTAREGAGMTEGTRAAEERAEDDEPAVTAEQMIAGEKTATFREAQATDDKPGTADATARTAAAPAATATAKVKPDDAMMSLEEYIASEEAAAKRRHRSLTAAVFASGMPSAGLPTKSNDYAYMDGRTSFEANNCDLTPTSSPAIGSGIENFGGYTNNPESPSGFEPVKYSEDHYNINGTRMNHSKPVNVGIALTMPLNNSLFVESGVYWSYLRSTSSLVTDQSLHSLGIPLKLGWRIGGWGRSSFSLSAGAKAEKVIYAVRDGVSFKEPGIQLAAVGDAAIQYDITRNLGIFIAPELSYWFTQTNLPTYNTEHPFNLSLKAGLNLTLGK